MKVEALADDNNKLEKNPVKNLKKPVILIKPISD